ncbi:MAG: flagellar basal body protein FliL [Sneathiella sp.]|jgi:flagellar FliL protein|uniref:flagellar basal body-associated FliL family protein n=1 Tax=Sneathiella sp. TaxID=1964365 RepID=UPI000C62A303|nr:flagellar basal body-associated FliL family protein [Sneathiella sp.]MAL80127.1 flagellar basal body protein FliL [Sneathiella sp.]|tara:strand:- start:165 stop:686 length:522 start_codon:yes stop_codon:yes gene_type:complete
MVDQIDEEGPDAEQGESGARKKKLSGKVLVLFILLPLLMIGGGVGGAYFAGLFDSPEPTEEELAAQAAEQNKKVVFYDLPEMLVNLNSGSSASSFLKLGVSLELADAAVVPDLELLIPRIMDNFQVYLRELRKEDLNGSQGIFRLKEELLMRINNAASPVRVNDVLFKEMLVQ